MSLIGLTGGFMTGKSTVADYLKAKGITVVDVDTVYHRKVLDCPEVKQRLVESFGPDIIAVGQEIDRTRLRKKVACCRANLNRLDEITHPYIVEEIKGIIEHLNKEKDIFFIEVPLLYEKKLESLFDKVVVVSSDLESQLRRSRIKCYSDQEALFFIEAQIPTKNKEARADFVIENNKGLNYLYEQTERMLKWLKN